MTETLHRPTNPNAEEIAFRTKQLDILKSLSSNETSEQTISETPETDVLDSVKLDFESGSEADRPVSPLASRITNAAERFAARLEKRAISKAYDQALKQYRKDDHSGYVDHVAGLASHSEMEEARAFNRNLLRKEERRSDREDLVDAGKDRLTDLGNIAVGLGVLGYGVAEKRAFKTARRVQNKLQDRSFAREDAKLHKQYERTVKKLDKQSAQQNAKLDKLAAKDSLRGKKYDEKFERSMARKQKWENRTEAVVSTLEKGARVAGNTYRSTKETYEHTRTLTSEKKRKMGKLIVHARNVGSATLADRK